jgi:hypothetical protein
MLESNLKEATMGLIIEVCGHVAVVAFVIFVGIVVVSAWVESGRPVKWDV